MNSYIAIADSIISKYGAPVAQSWHKYAVAKSYGLAAAVGLGTLLALLS